MLNSDFDLEADLGIDTVKQVEIFDKIFYNNRVGDVIIFYD